MFAEPVSVNVSMAENVALPETKSDPVTITPFDAVTDAKCASLPLTITLFHVGKCYSIMLVTSMIS